MHKTKKQQQIYYQLIVIFVLKHIKIIFFLFLKIIFKISTSKQSKTYKKIILNKTNLKF
jgi:hypothetical protein